MNLLTSLIQKKATWSLDLTRALKKPIPVVRELAGAVCAGAVYSA